MREVGRRRLDGAVQPGPVLPAPRGQQKPANVSRKALYHFPQNLREPRRGRSHKFSHPLNHRETKTVSPPRHRVRSIIHHKGTKARRSDGTCNKAALCLCAFVVISGNFNIPGHKANRGFTEKRKNLRELWALCFKLRTSNFKLPSMVPFPERKGTLRIWRSSREP